MKRSVERTLTTHMGSLPRGGVLAELLIARDNGDAVDEARLARETERAVREAVRVQHAAGIDVANDGEQPRVSFQTYVTSRMRGFGGEGRRPLPRETRLFPKWAQLLKSRRPARSRVFNAPAALGPVRYEDLSGAEAECRLLTAALADIDPPFAETFMTAASPGIVATTMMNQHYDSHEDYVLALAAELGKEYAYVASQGFLLQIDAPDLAMERASFFQDLGTAGFQANVELHVEAINVAIGDIPADRVRLHCCWGNRDGPHTEDVPLADILHLLGRAKVGALCLPFANPRHSHEVELLRTSPLPADWLLVAGVIETTSNYVEHPEVVAERIQRAVAAVGDRERVIAGTDCGFGTFAGDGFVAEDVVPAKLATLAEGARLASARLWS